jgi:hypothetical protein
MCECLKDGPCRFDIGRERNPWQSPNILRLTVHFAAAKVNYRRVTHVDASLELVADLANRQAHDRCPKNK